MHESQEERQRWRHVQDLFHRARELASDRQAEFLRRHCGGDDALLGEVTGLLDDALPERSGGAPKATPREDLSGLTLGDYRLVRIIGEGSMGVIYEARQSYVERSVALKILRRRREVLENGGSPEVYERMTQRFAAEAEVLGRLDHPGIVPIHEMGHEDGRNYFTMRLVRGEDLRDIIARVVSQPASDWSLERALGVVLRVCETMAFAHDRGVLHRDLKPSHVMVGGFGEVYIVDWGLAKLPGPRERDIRLREESCMPRAAAATSAPTPLRTVEGDAIGTPAYMPPEQARGELAKMGVVSDVYAVGALLYHLLTGEVPYVGLSEHPSAYTVLERVRRGPPTPLLEAAPAVAPALAAICEKAMARDVGVRYPTMDALAQDLRAFLENRVVQAHRTGAAVELWKWLQRNRVVASAGGLVLALLIGWVGSILWIQESQNRDLSAAVLATRLERDRARDQADIARATTDFLDDMFRSVHPVEAQGEVVTVRDALDRAVQRLNGAFPDQPRVEAAIRMTLGVAYHQLGLHREAEPHLLWSFETRRELLGMSSPETLASMGEYGVLLGELGRFDEAEVVLRGALELSAAAFGAGSREAMAMIASLCQLLFDRGSLDEAEERALFLLTAEGSSDEDHLVALEVLGSIRTRQNRFDEAEDYFGRQLGLNRVLYGEGHSNTLIATGNLAATLDALGRHDEARALGLELVERQAEIFGVRHRNTLFAMANAGILLCNQGAIEEGTRLLAETLTYQRQVFGDDHPETMLATYNLAEVLRRDGRFADAVPLYRTLLSWQRDHLDDDHADLRRGLHGLADCRIHQKELEAAAELLRELHSLQVRNAGAALAKAAELSSTAWQLERCYEMLGWTEELQAFRIELGGGEAVAR